MITIRHDRAETVAEGTTKGDGTAPILKGNGFRWTPSVGAWTLNRTWHEGTRRGRALAAVAALQAAGHAAELDADTTTPAVSSAEDVAAREADRAERAAARVDRFEARAERTEAAGEAAWNKASATAALIPFGQPILRGHHSERRARRDAERICNGYEKGARLAREAEQLADRARAAEANQRHRESLPTTLRRIERIEAERRDIGRRIDGTSAAVSKPAEGEYLARLNVMATELDAELEHWRNHVAASQAGGARVFGRADFKPGDWAMLRGHRWMRVVKANPKTLALETGHMPWPLKSPYSDVLDMRTAEQAEQIAAARADAAQVTA